MKQRVFLLFVLVLLAACTPAQQATSTVAVTVAPDSAVTSPPEETIPTNGPVENPFSSKAGDSKLVRQKAFVQEASLVIRESSPPQISLQLSGDLPTPCNQLRADIGRPSKDNKINIDVYSVVDPNLICTQVVKPFEENINLGTFPSGHYSVFVNGASVGDFDS